MALAAPTVTVPRTIALELDGGAARRIGPVPMLVGAVAGVAGSSPGGAIGKVLYYHYTMKVAFCDHKLA